MLLQQGSEPEYYFHFAACWGRAGEHIVGQKQAVGAAGQVVKASSDLALGTYLRHLTLSGLVVPVL